MLCQTKHTRRVTTAPVGITGLLLVALLVSACTGSSATGRRSGSQSSGVAAASVGLSIAPTGTNINPAQPVTITVADGKLDNVSVTNAARGNTVRGTLSPNRTKWTSTEALGYGNTYAIDVKATTSSGKQVSKRSQVTTLKPTDTYEANLIPAPNLVQRSGIGVGQPIVFQFTKPVKDRAAVEKKLSVKSYPAQQGAWYWVDDKNAHYRPEEYWKPGTRIDVSGKVYGVDLGGGVYGGSDTTATYKVHDSWVAKADGNTNAMRIFHNGKMVKSMPMSMGKNSTPTHQGAHVIFEKHKNFLMDSCTYGVCKGDPNYYRSWERWSARISNDGEFVHENPASIGAQGNSNVSHGCINLNAANAQWFYEHLGYGDVVEVTNSGGPKLPLYDLYGDWSLSWKQWQQGSALK